MSRWLFIEIQRNALGIQQLHSNSAGYRGIAFPNFISDSILTGL